MYRVFRTFLVFCALSLPASAQDATPAGQLPDDLLERPADVGADQSEDAVPAGQLPDDLLVRPADVSADQFEDAIPALPLPDDLRERLAPLRPADVSADQSGYDGTTPAIILFADVADDRLFVEQLEVLAEDAERFAERNVVLLLDTDPAAEGALRRQLRPRGFRLVLLDASGDVVRRLPLVTTTHWLIREIDEMR